MAKLLNAGKSKMPYSGKGEAVGAIEKAQPKGKVAGGKRKPVQKL